MTRRSLLANGPLFGSLSWLLPTSPAATGTAVTAQNTFGFSLLKTLFPKSPDSNVFISPLSIFLALAMTENGAAGATKAAMRKALVLPESETDAALNAAISELQGTLGREKGVELAIANALWAHRTITLDPAFVALCKDVFGAQATTLDFRNASAAGTINSWVNQETRGKIPEIVNSDGVAKSSVILTNAVYFHGQWLRPFPKADTKDARFHKPGGATKTVRMMRHSNLKSEYRSGPGFEGAALPYQNSQIACFVLLPEAGKAPEQILTSLDWQRLRTEGSDYDLDLSLPRFTLDYSAGLSQSLSQMGMAVAFRPGADFSRLGPGDFFIGDVLHKTRLEVDEQGTVAAAATAVGVRSAAMAAPREKKVLVFDRPFAILLADRATGTILFAGVIKDPQT